MSEKTLLGQTQDERDRLLLEYIEAEKVRREAEREYRSICDRAERLFSDAAKAQMAAWALEGKVDKTMGKANSEVRSRMGELKRQPT